MALKRKKERKTCMDHHTVFSCVRRYIDDGDDRKSFSLVCREWYEIDSLIREELTVQLFYATTLSSRVSKRFPFLKSLTLEGLENFRALDEPLLDVTLWIKEIVTTYDYLEDLDLSYVQVGDENLKLLAKTRGKQLRGLWIYECDNFSTDGLKHICHHCINLTTLWLQNNRIIIKDAEWLHELALHNTCIEELTFFNPDIDFDVNDLTLLAKNCSESLQCVNISSSFKIVDLKDFFNCAVMLESFGGCNHSAKTEDYVGFKYPPNMRCMEFVGSISKDELGLVVPFEHQLMHLQLYDTKQDDQCFLLERCPNLESLYADNIYGNKGLQLLSRICRNLRIIRIYKKHVSDKGLITLAQGCLQLERITIKLKDISEEALVCLGAHLKNLRSFDMTSLDRNKRTDHIPAEGIRALLIGCTKLEELSINLDHRRLTPVGMRYIGKYGCELRHLSLNFTGIPTLKKLSKGCPKLRVLTIEDSEFSKEEDLSFVFNNITSLRYIYVWDENYRQYLATTRPDFEQVLL